MLIIFVSPTLETRQDFMFKKSYYPTRCRQKPNSSYHKLSVIIYTTSEKRIVVEKRENKAAVLYLLYWQLSFKKAGGVVILKMFLSRTKMFYESNMWQKNCFDILQVFKLPFLQLVGKTSSTAKFIATHILQQFSHKF